MLSTLTVIGANDDEESTSEHRRLRAVVYLRVSTPKQASKGFDRDGYSLPAQLDACRRKAEQLGADVIEEYIDRGESAKTDDRPRFLAMAERVKAERDVDYVILHKLDRFARNVRDDANHFFELKMAGAQLVSVSENIDETPQGMLLHWIMAAIAEFYSANLSTEVKKGSLQKAKNGGTPGIAATGYLNVQERIEGHPVATVIPDPDRADLIRFAFEAYATGEFTLRQLQVEMAERGLTCRPTAKYPEAPLSLSKLAKVLRNPYYLGIVTYNGIQYPGRHERLVDVETFARVQQLMDGRVQAGEKQRIHQHYLKGTLFCRRCHSRLGMTYATGRHGGIYPYFFCLGRQRRNGCDLPYLQVDGVEERVERLYGRIQLSNDEVAALRAELQSLLAAEAGEAEKKQKRLERHIAKLNQQRYVWADKVTQGSVPDDIGREKQALLARQLVSAQADLAELQATPADLSATLDQALALVSSCQTGYAQAEERLKRRWNQLFFKQVNLDVKEVCEPSLSPVIAALRPLPSPSPALGRRAFPHKGQRNNEPGLVLVGRGSSEEHLVGAEGLEPPTTAL